MKETGRPPFLFLSGHDFRSPRKANVHFIVAELSRRGRTRVFSFGFSYLSIHKKDPRLSLWKNANRVETVAGVDCFLWRTIVHPINLRVPVLEPLAALWFKFYRKHVPKYLKQWVLESKTIFIESGMGILFVRLIKMINPLAEIIYIASDDLNTIGCSQFLEQEFSKTIHLFDGVRLTSPMLAPLLPDSKNRVFVPHGLDKTIAKHADPSPYRRGKNVVSVGSMLFDPGFFAVAAAAFPDICFHVIGGGRAAAGLSAPNIVLHDEMPYLRTIPYIKHADVGVAPYEARRVVPYLADTSMKLMQYSFFGIPAVCPAIAAGDFPWRFGYAPDDSQGVVSAMRRALEFGRFPPPPTLDWSEVTDRILNPEAYADTNLGHYIKGPSHQFPQRIMP